MPRERGQRDEEAADPGFFFFFFLTFHGLRLFRSLEGSGGGLGGSIGTERDHTNPAGPLFFFVGGAGDVSCLWGKGGFSEFVMSQENLYTLIFEFANLPKNTWTIERKERMFMAMGLERMGPSVLGACPFPKGGRNEFL